MPISWDRPELQRLLDQLRKGDVLVVWKLDGLSRSLSMESLRALFDRLATRTATTGRFNCCESLAMR
jgi:DNA invertase Pin-like site-specific DNA recombinase